MAKKKKKKCCSRRFRFLRKRKRKTWNGSHMDSHSPTFSGLQLTGTDHDPPYGPYGSYYVLN